MICSCRCLRRRRFECTGFAVLIKIADRFHAAGPGTCPAQKFVNIVSAPQNRPNEDQKDQLKDQSLQFSFQQQTSLLIFCIRTCFFLLPLLSMHTLPTTRSSFHILRATREMVSHKMAHCCVGIVRLRRGRDQCWAGIGKINTRGYGYLTNQERLREVGCRV